MPTMGTIVRNNFIIEAVLAIINQDYKNWELIIQNGGLPMTLPYDDDRVKIYNEPDTGITDAMNKGMAKATGDIFNWSNDDDMMNPGTLSFVNEILKETGWLYSKIQYTNGGEWGSPWHGVDALIQGNYVPQPSVFWTRDAYNHLGDMDMTQDLTSDYDYWIRLAKYHEPQFISERYLATYRIHQDQITNTRTAEQIAQARQTSLKHGNH